MHIPGKRDAAKVGHDIGKELRRFCVANGLKTSDAAKYLRNDDKSKKKKDDSSSESDDDEEDKNSSGSESEKTGSDEDEEDDDEHNEDEDEDDGDIDEDNDDEEEEQRARPGKKGSAKRGPEPSDLLEDHRKKNKRGKPPNPTALRARGVVTHARANQGTEPQQKPRASRNSKAGKCSPKPKLSDFESEDLRKCLQEALSSYRAMLAACYPWPDQLERSAMTATAYRIGREFVRRNDGNMKMVPKKASKEAKKLIQASGSQLRGEIVDRAKIYVSAKDDPYELQPPLGSRLAGSDRKMYTKNRTKSLLKEGQYTRRVASDGTLGPPFSHPVIFNVLALSWYCHARDIWEIDTIFKDKVPFAALCLAATAVHCALDNVLQDPGDTISFAEKRYKKVYNTAMGNLKLHMFNVGMNKFHLFRQNLHHNLLQVPGQARRDKSTEETDDLEVWNMGEDVFGSDGLQDFMGFE